MALQGAKADGSEVSGGSEIRWCGVIQYLSWRNRRIRRWEG